VLYYYVVHLQKNGVTVKGAIPTQQFVLSSRIELQEKAAENSFKRNKAFSL